VLGLLTFSVLAWRNLTPALLMLAPILTGTLARALGEPDPTPAGAPRPRLARTSAVVVALGLVASLVMAAAQNPVVDPQMPRGLLAKVAATSSPQRVLNTYNVAGPLLWFGGRPPHVTVGIDGRSDRYGSEYATSYQDGLVQARPGWQVLFDQLHPTAALLGGAEALGPVLVAERGWVEVGREHGWVLLRAPDAPGWPTA